MKSTRSIFAISFALLFGWMSCKACGPYMAMEPSNLRMFRCCSPTLESQWNEGCRFQEYEKQENCLLWQKITSTSIPLKDIEYVVYDASLRDLQDLSTGSMPDNKFATWLSAPEHHEDMEYMLVAKEIEEIRNYMNNPWYYPYDGDEEHMRLEQLMAKCVAYSGIRHADRYALQLARLCFANKRFDDCIDLWENKVSSLPQNIVTDMVASYVGGAYYRKGHRDRAIELYTRSQDIGSLIALKAWADAEEHSSYSDPRIKEMEYIFNRFPNSPLLSVRLQEYVRLREDIARLKEDDDCYTYHHNTNVTYHGYGDSFGVNEEKEFYDELKRFALRAASSGKCNQKGMWNYALSYLYYLDGDKATASRYLSAAERSQSTPLVKESIRALRFLMNATYANNSRGYRKQLFNDLKWLDGMMLDDVKLQADDDWHYSNNYNWSITYWQDVARKVLLGEVCPRMEKCGDKTLSLQLANYAVNRIYQVSPLYKASGYLDDDGWFSSAIITIDEYRNKWPDINWLDYDSQFFEMICQASAADAARYAERITRPQTELDRFLNVRGYVDTDYIYDVVGTLYLREMNYSKATEWFAKVSSNYQARTNIAKYGYFRLDPFKYQTSEKNFIADSTDYKLRFSQEMARLEAMIASDIEPNRKANAKIRYATGMRNSFGRCWYLTDYGFSSDYDRDDGWKCFGSYDRRSYKDNPYAVQAYRQVDRLMEEALSEFTDPEQAAQAHLDMMNFKTVVSLYPDSKASEYVRGHCDKYADYAIQKL